MSLPSYDLHGGIRGEDETLVSMPHLVTTAVLALLVLAVLVR